MSQNSKIEKSYDELTYKSIAFAQSSPYRLEACATLLGITPPPCENARVLEIGCSFGGNLIPFAVNNKNAKVVGIDLSGEQIRRGQEIVKEMGLTNLDLIHGDICEFKSYEKFDYIIAHGVFSWVPDFVKEAILKVVRENLSANGVAFISYNVYPGWKVKDIIRDIMLLAAKDKETMQDKLKAAKEALLVYKEYLLTRDKELANGNPNVAAEILVQKAILQEAKNEKLTEEEQYNLDLAKQEVEVSFYLQKKFDKEFSTVSNVSDEEAKKYYDEHKSEIGNTPFETIKAAIVNEIIYQKQTEIVHKYYDDLAEKYKINDILNKEYPQEATNTDNTKTEEKK